METTNKLVFVPHSTFKNLVNQQQNLLEPIKKQIHLIDNEATNILSDKNVGTERKFSEYYQYLRRQKNLMDESKKPIKIEVTERKNNDLANDDLPLPEDTIINDLPNNAKTRGKILLHHIKNRPEIKFNRKGELVIQDKQIDGSNAIDLIHYIARERHKSKIAPPGFNELYKILKDTNVPNEALGSMKIDKTTFYSTPLSTSTPKAKSKQHSYFEQESELYEDSDDGNSLFFNKSLGKKKYTSQKGRKTKVPFQYGQGLFKWKRYR